MHVYLMLVYANKNNIEKIKENSARRYMIDD